MGRKKRSPCPLAVGKARELLRRLRIRHEDEIEVELIAAELRLFVRSRAMTTAEGRLVCSRAGGFISVADRAYRSHKWRFVVAHEIGHFLRHSQLNQLDLCKDVDLRATYRGREAEANDFAAELLMPEALFAKRCDVARPSLREVGELASAFRTSLTSAALRFVHFSDEPCAVVHSTHGRVDWVAPTRDFLLFVPVGAKLTKTTYAGDLHAGRSVPDAPNVLGGEAWSDMRGAEDVDLVEHSRKVAASSVITLLWHECDS
ncbi:MAG: ImmA/IrrE family metallo-endopeptidase [Myxococcales bacterium]|nr:ImmA/IrrE family metallo-endopeptidase [Myxococcales bacterium]